jgi:hypothetical protein
MKKKLLITALAFCFSLAFFAQTAPQRNCGTLQHHDYLKLTRPNYENDLNNYNVMIEQYLAAQQSGTARMAALPTVTVPVVVHVLYRVAGENISDAQAISQVQVLNDDFAKLNADKIKVTQATFSTAATGANIRFCLAQRDPLGNATTGVTHKTTTVTAFTTDDKVKNNATGGQTAWDVTKYVNIWVCNLGPSLLGYGEFPTGTLSNTWGLVLHYKYTGSGGTAIAPYNLGRTGTHEFGHCFNLYHIWGDDGTACSGSDLCSDTPNQAGNHFGCYTAGSVQTDGCTATAPGVMWMNYMDYTDDACMYMFTAQQCARMEAIVNTAPWNVLGTSNACTPVSALDAGMSAISTPSNGSSSCNTTVIPKVTLNNVGSTTLVSATINYKMDATATQTLAWAGSLATSASTVLTLSTYSGLSVAAHTFSVWVSNPNAGVDANAINNNLSSTFSVVAVPVGSALPFVQNFEAATFLPLGWTKIMANTTNTVNTWSRVLNTTGVTAGSTACAKMDNFSGTIDITGQIDALRTPAVSFVGANSSLSLTFDVSHKMYSAVDIDSLNVYISSDCGGSWTRLYTKGGTLLSTSAGTSTAVYTPTANAQWRKETVGLGLYAGLPSVYLKFESRSGWGNNLYLDNVNISYTVAAVPPTASLTASSPKCINSPITFNDASTNLPTSWNWTFVGGTPSTATTSSVNVTYTAAGTYTVTHTATNSSGTSATYTQAIVVNPLPAVTLNTVAICIGNTAILTAGGASTYTWSTGPTTTSISVTPSVTTVYSVTATSTLGCVNTKSTTVTVNALPTITATSPTICVGASTVIIAGGASTYTWNTGATTISVAVTPSVTTNYTVIGKSALGCVNTKTTSVTVNNLPSVSVISATICSGSTGTLIASGASTYAWNTGATGANLVVSPLATTNYTVTGTSTFGCIKTATGSIVVGTAAVISVNSPTICVGSTISLNASGVSTYTWNTGVNTSSITVSPIATTVYTVSGNLVGCAGVATKTTAVYVNALPVVTLGTITSPLCTNSPTVALVGAPASGTYSGTGVVGSIFNPSISGSGAFTVSYYYTDVNGCSNSATQPVNVSLCTGIIEATNLEISIYPNPAKDLIYVTLPTDEFNNTAIELYDAIGKLILVENVVSKTTLVSLNNLAKGIYTVRVISEKAHTTTRIIKE